MTLPASVETKIEEIGETHFHDPSDFKARGAREMAEWLCELVCENCGDDSARHDGVCRKTDLEEWIPVTRAEFIRRNPT